MIFSEIKLELQKVIDYQFNNDEILRQAICHSSYANEVKTYVQPDYERIEFLGDAVLELVSSEFFFLNYSSMSEGEMTRKRASMVCELALAYCAREIGLEKFILLGRGEERTGGRNRDSIISDVCEAVIGAIYLDGGLEEAKKFIHRVILSDIEKKQLFYDSKTLLQEKVQKTKNSEIEYRTVSESGPDHEKEFQVEVWVDGKRLGSGNGHTKKAAQQKAAYQALLGRGR